jgi:hypothetical protein
MRFQEAPVTKVLNMPERQDAEGSWHMVLKDVCGWCGCGYFVAEDDHDLVWEPGRHHDKQCSDDACECHTRARVGKRHDDW